MSDLMGHYRSGVFHGAGLMKGGAKVLAPLPGHLKAIALGVLLLVAMVACTAIVNTQPRPQPRPSVCADPTVPECQPVAPVPAGVAR